VVPSAAARPSDGTLQAHAAIEQIDRDLKDRRPDTVRAAGAERRHRAVGFENDGGRHHRGKPYPFSPGVEATSRQVLLAKHVVQHEAEVSDDVTVALAVGETDRGCVSLCVDHADMSRAAISLR